MMKGTEDNNSKNHKNQLTCLKWVLVMASFALWDLVHFVTSNTRLEWQSALVLYLFDPKGLLLGKKE